MTKRPKPCSMTINVANAARMKTIKTILGYESGLRGLTMGQTFAQLILQSANMQSYPQEVQDQLARIAEEKRRMAARRSLEVARGGRKVEHETEMPSRGI